ncbi:CoA-transferase subunit beta [Dethiosulfatarculus sandiegensis]|uniref:3-ketoacid CoA transferase n=1 Tax=Dethiosulfatarculus sandiegensis TaxID=1429043 RepID=A0A0D2JXB4_9BACT|nr:CoA-transferase [Dethiosulfatarculus sandiegensis]KIX14235.1 3-ketoacid CoA transferase [Dethiosulfatarculus sandiegensis]
MASYTDKEIMAISAGRLIGQNDVLFAGTGVSMLAATVAKRVHAPNAVVFFETGGIDPSLDELPLAVADPRVMYGSCVNSGLIEAFAILGHRKLRTVAFLGAAQIDSFGNLNSTVIGDYNRPKVRFPGSGGGCDAASLAHDTIIFMQHEPRRFVNELDYFTSPGWLRGGESRMEAGYTRGGPMAVVTDLGVLKFHSKTKRMYLAECYPGVSPEKIIENTSFELDVSQAKETRAPDERELKVLREEVDPQRLILG